MNKAYYRINNGDGWENYPSEKTPLNKHNLDKGDIALDEIDNRVIHLDTAKFNKSDAQLLIKDITFDLQTGILTKYYLNGSREEINTGISKLNLDLRFDRENQILYIVNADGTEEPIDLSLFVTNYEFRDSNTIVHNVSSDGKVTSIVKDGSIGEEHLRPNYLADIKVEAAKADASKKAAAVSEANAKASENAAKESQTAAKESEINAAASAESAAGSADTATNKASDASDSAAAAKKSEAAAKESETASKASETAAAKSAENAAASETAAGEKASEAATYATQSKSYAVGGTGTRENENIDNSKYYYEQSKTISERLSGALHPKGTVAFANLPELSSADEGDMYNISDQFITNANFKEGSGLVIPAGSNVYKTADGYWDVLAGSPVAGIKGNAETSYRKGNVNITPENIGLGNVGNFKAVSTVASQGLSNTEKSNARANIGAGTSSFSGNYNDLSNKPDIPSITGAASTITSSNLTANRALVSNGNGKVVASAVTSTELGYLDGVTSSVQGQLNQLNMDLAGKLDKSGGTISGDDLNVNGSNGTKGLRIRRDGSDHESAKLTVDDAGLVVDSMQDEDRACIIFNLIYTDTEKNGGANAGKKTIKFWASNAEGTRLIIDSVEISKIFGQNVAFGTPPRAEGILLGGSDFSYVYGDKDDVYMRYKDGNGKAAYASAKTIMDLIAAINDKLSKATTIALTTVAAASSAGSLFPDVPSYYTVKNGWCVFHIWLKFTGNVGNWYPFYLPKSAIANHLYFEDGYEHNGQLRIEQNGRVRISDTKASATASHYWGCYPTA